jgi:hypothetical protein
MLRNGPRHVRTQYMYRVSPSTYYTITLALRGLVSIGTSISVRDKGGGTDRRRQPDDNVRDCAMAACYVCRGV